MADYEEEPQIVDDPTDVLEINAVIDSIKGQVSSAQFSSAIVTAATFSPLKVKSPSIKQNFLDLWASLFTNYSVVQSVVDGMTIEQRTGLAIYASKVMALLGDKRQCENALGWYNAVVKKDGNGVINRVLINRK